MQQSFNKICRTMRSSCARCPQLHSPPLHARSSALMLAVLLSTAAPGKATLKPCCDTAPGYMQVDELLAMDADNEEYRDLQTSLVEVCDLCCKLTSHGRARRLLAACVGKGRQAVQAACKGKGSGCGWA